MSKSIFLTLIILIANSVLIAQTLQLTNRTVSDKNSRTVYIGVDNNFEIQGETFKVIVPQNGVSLKGNELTVRPNKIGKLTVLFFTKEGKMRVTFDARTLPEIMVSVAGQTSNELSKDLILNESELALKTVNSDESFFDHYKVASFTTILNGRILKVSGDVFPSELLSAIKNAKSGDTLVINSLTAFNQDVNKTIYFNSNYSFKIQ